MLAVVKKLLFVFFQWQFFPSAFFSRPFLSRFFFLDSEENIDVKLMHCHLFEKRQWNANLLSITF